METVMDPRQKALIEGAMAGHKDDLEALLKYCMRDMLHMAILHSNRQEAEDIVQEVAIVLYKKIKTLSNPYSFRPWLSMVIRNASIDHMRKIYKTRDKVDYEEDLEQVELIADNIEFLPEKYVENDELRSIIIEEINVLPKMQEICLSYYYLQEFKRSDIAKATGLSPRQVSSALNYGKQTLKKRLEQRFGKNFAYSTVPVGTIPALARVFEAKRDEMVSMEWCEQMCQTVSSKLNGAELTSRGNTITTTVVACTVCAIVAGVAVYMLYPDGGQEPYEPPPVIEIQPEVDDLPPVESEESESEIRTVADMIGEDEAENLEWYVDNGMTLEEWDGFVERIRATFDRQGTSVRNTYTIYLLEKQNKRLLLARQESPEGQIRIRYLFGDRDEPEEIMAGIILLFVE